MVALTRATIWRWSPASIPFPVVAMTMLGVITGVAQAAGVVPIPGDAAVYWLATPGANASGGYAFPPVLAQALVPLHVLPWQVFIAGWTTLCFASLGYVAGRWAFLCAALVVPDVALGPGDHCWAGPIEAALLGNVTLPMVAAMVAGLRRPGWWAVPLLTKLTPGIGLLWFAFRRDWRAFGIGAGVTAAVVGVSFALDPGAWVSFLRFAFDNAGATSNGPPIVGPPLWLRLTLSVVLIGWGARTSRPWVVPIAGALSLIGLYGLATFAAVAVAALRFRPSSEQFYEQVAGANRSAGSSVPIAGHPTQAIKASTVHTA